MTNFIKPSDFLENRVPDFVNEEGPNFVAFLKSYYEWLEQANNAIEVSKNLLNYQDIDTTNEKYLEFIRREVIPSFPREMAANTAIVAKNIIDLYRARGSEKSYRMLFRILYGEEIDVYLPSKDILRVSDGRWVQENTIRVGLPSAGNTASFSGLTVVGNSSGATGIVERIDNTFEGGVFVYELFLENIDGTFIDGETVRDSENNISATIINSVGPLQTVTINQGGAFHNREDVITLTSSSGSGAIGSITSVSDDSAVEFVINDGGSGYRVNQTVYVLSGGSGTGAAFTIDTITNTEVLSLNSDTIESFANVVINTNPTFVSLGANSAAVSANLASANVSTPLNATLSFSNTTVGSINSITTTNEGFGYSTVPTVFVYDLDVSAQSIDDGSGGFKGNNAIIVARNVAGSIQSVNITQFGTGYRRFDEVTVSNQTRTGTVDAKGDPGVSGVVARPGRYVDTKGWLSWNNKLQDNYYYQAFSYEIRSKQLTNTYRDLVKNILNPAGSLMFGRVEIENFTDAVMVAANTDSYTLWTNGTGTISIGIIEPFANAVINTYASNTIIAFVENIKEVVGSNTLFSAEIPNTNTAIAIVDVNGSEPEKLLYTNAVSNNTHMTLKTAYGNALEAGTYRYTSNTAP